VPPTPTAPAAGGDAAAAQVPAPAAGSPANPTGARSALAPAGSGAAARPATAAAAPHTVEDGGTYFGEVRLADGSAVKLSGIAYSDASPVAVINGKVVGPGQVVDDVTVDKIEPDRVTLRHRTGILFYLRPS
jgi:hypothetical protein